MLRLLFIALLSLSAAAQAGGRAHWSAPVVAGMLVNDSLSEISGLAASRQHPGIFWSHNDGGNRAELLAINGKGEHQATLNIAGIDNIDWEDLAYFSRDGRHYLMIADTGDNGGIRSELRLIVIEEPSHLTPHAEVSPVWVQHFRWPDGPRDCEAMAVDSTHGEVLLISKKRVPAELFRLPLTPSSSVQTAELIGLFPSIRQPNTKDLQANPVYGRYRSQITAADLSPNGRVLAVLNYSTLYFYVRPTGKNWQAVLPDITPGQLVLPWLPQAEAVAFTADGKSVLIASEQPSPLLRYDVIR